MKATGSFLVMYIEFLDLQWRTEKGSNVEYNDAMLSNCFPFKNYIEIGPKSGFSTASSALSRPPIW